MSKKFNCEQMFEEYLDRVNLNKSNMAEVQLRETKRAFFAGLGTMLVTFTQDLVQFQNTKIRVAMVQRMTEEIMAFWNWEATKDDAGKKQDSPQRN